MGRHYGLTNRNYSLLRYLPPIDMEMVMIMIIVVDVDVDDVVDGSGDVDVDDVDENLFRLSINSLQVHVDEVVDKRNKSSSSSLSPSLS